MWAGEEDSGKRKPPLSQGRRKRKKCNGKNEGKKGRSGLGSGKNLFLRKGQIRNLPEGNPPSGKSRPSDYKGRGRGKEETRRGGGKTYRRRDPSSS